VALNVYDLWIEDNPTRIDDMFWHSALEFINAIRAELGLTLLVQDTYADPMKTLDRELFDAYRSSQPNSPSA
jgi:hypothetical protein